MHILDYPECYLYQADNHPQSQGIVTTIRMVSWSRLTLLYRSSREPPPSPLQALQALRYPHLPAYNFVRYTGGRDYLLPSSTVSNIIQNLCKNKRYSKQFLACLGELNQVVASFFIFQRSVDFDSFGINPDMSMASP